MCFIQMRYVYYSYESARLLQCTPVNRMHVRLTCSAALASHERPRALFARSTDVSRLATGQSALAAMYECVLYSHLYMCTSSPYAYAYTVVVHTARENSVRRRVVLKARCCRGELTAATRNSQEHCL